MCGGFKPSRQWIVGKEEAQAKKYQKLAELRSGSEYTWPTVNGDVVAVFGGHARKESLNGCWKDKIEKHVKISAETFSERNTVDGTKKFVEFKVPAGKAIHGVIMKKSHELRIVTQPASEKVSKVHNRQPDFVNMKSISKFVVYKLKGKNE